MFNFLFGHSALHLVNHEFIIFLRFQFIIIHLVAQSTLGFTPINLTLTIVSVLSTFDKVVGSNSWVSFEKTFLLFSSRVKKTKVSAHVLLSIHFVMLGNV